jgi:hypothetical protein
MFSRIQDLPRFKADCKRFTLGIQGVSGDLAKEGEALFNALLDAVQSFDLATVNLIKQVAGSGHLDHATSQTQVQNTKEAMELWMNKNAPNVHVDEQEFIEAIGHSAELAK